MKSLSFLRNLGRFKSLGNRNQVTPFIFCLVALYLIELFIFWPGIIRPDSLLQLQQAHTGIFSDHHPPIMGFYWYFLSFIYPGPGLLFLTHLTLLFGAALIFAFAFQDSRLSWFYLIILIWPQIVSYSAFVLKDIGFTFTFLFVASILSFYSLQRKKLPIMLVFIICILLFYGTAVKFQAAFILPFMSLWLAYCLNSYHVSLKVFFNGMVLFCLLFSSVQLFNHCMTQKKDYSWQLVKLYYLAGISLREDKEIFPDFVKNEPFYSMEALAKTYNTQRVDELVFDTNPLLIKGRTHEQRNALWYMWFQTVQKYPESYLSHRWAIFQNLIHKSPIKSISEIASHQEFIPALIKDILLVYDSYGLTAFLKAITTFKFYLPLMLLYLVLGFVCIRRDPYAIPLVFLNLMGLTLLGVLFVFSMASDVRYIYLTMCCFHFSHPFFFKVFKGLTSTIYEWSIILLNNRRLFFHRVRLNWSRCVQLK